MGLSGYTKPFAVLGHPIGHSLSPVMHNASMASIDLMGFISHWMCIQID